MWRRGSDLVTYDLILYDGTIQTPWLPGNGLFTHREAPVSPAPSRIHPVPSVPYTLTS